MGGAGPLAGEGPSGTGVVWTTPGTKIRGSCGGGGWAHETCLSGSIFPWTCPGREERARLAESCRTRLPWSGRGAGARTVAFLPKTHSLVLALRRRHTDPTGGTLSRGTDQQSSGASRLRSGQHVCSEVSWGRREWE